MIYIRLLVSAVAALYYSTRHVKSFDIKARELKRYYLKSFNLAICYSSFCNTNSVKALCRAGLAAYFSCAYDIITDWRNYDKESQIKYFEILKKYVNDEIYNLTCNLYCKDKEGNLFDDGLERGTMSVLFITKLIGSEFYFRNICDLEHFGYLLQITDDIIDLEEDSFEGDLNCLLTSNRNKYLNEYIDFFESGRGEFFADSSFVMRILISRTLERAHELVDSTSPLN